MKSKLSEEALEKRRVALETRKARRNKKLIIGEWTLFRFDEYNWCIQHGNDDYLYYPTFHDAIVGLVRRIGPQEASSSLVQMKNEMLRIEDEMIKKINIIWDNAEAFTES